MKIQNILSVALVSVLSLSSLSLANASNEECCRPSRGSEGPRGNPQPPRRDDRGPQRGGNQQPPRRDDDRRPGGYQPPRHTPSYPAPRPIPRPAPRPPVYTGPIYTPPPVYIPPVYHPPIYTGGGYDTVYTSTSCSTRQASDIYEEVDSLVASHASNKALATFLEELADVLRESKSSVKEARLSALFSISKKSPTGAEIISAYHSKLIALGLSKDEADASVARLIANLSDN